MGEEFKSKAEELLAEITALAEAHGVVMQDSTLQEFAKLSPTRQRRGLAALAGKTTSQIAAEENVSKQAAAKSLAAPAVRQAVRELIAGAYAIEQVDGAREKVPFIDAAIKALYRLLSAKKPVICGATYAMEADNPTRLAAALKIIELYEPRSSQPTPAAPPTVEESTVVEETATATRRVARRRRMVG